MTGIRKADKVQKVYQNRVTEKPKWMKPHQTRRTQMKNCHTRCKPLQKIFRRSAAITNFIQKNVKTVGTTKICRKKPRLTINSTYSLLVWYSTWSDFPRSTKLYNVLSSKNVRHPNIHTGFDLAFNISLMELWPINPPDQPDSASQMIVNI